MAILETRSLCKRYGTAMRVNGLNLSVPEGSIYGFLGPNGAGKSTTLKMALGLVHPTSGAVKLFGKEMNAANMRDILRRTGSLIEAPSYYGHLTGKENLEVIRQMKGAPEKDVDEVLRIVRLDGQKDKRAAHYSLGMKQRLGLAGALLGYPKLLILDEPTNGLDPAGIQEMRELILELPERFGMTVVVSSHLLSEIDQIAGHVGIIREGELCVSGQHGGAPRPQHAPSGAAHGKRPRRGKAAARARDRGRHTGRAADPAGADGWRDGGGRARPRRKPRRRYAAGGAAKEP